jgi:hypothetical protein
MAKLFSRGVDQFSFPQQCMSDPFHSQRFVLSWLCILAIWVHILAAYFKVRNSRVDFTAMHYHGDGKAH